MHTKEKVWRTNAGYLAAVLMTDIGYRCGYVGIPSSHPLYRRHYGEHTPELGVLWETTKEGFINKRGIIPVLCAISGNVSADVIFNVHGSITFSDGADWNYIYPVPNTNLWWFGYDCAHTGDGKDLSAMSAKRKQFFYSDGPIRSLKYCIGECESLAYQLKLAQKSYTNLLLRSF